jgi:hypothetical protein
MFVNMQQDSNPKGTVVVAARLDPQLKHDLEQLAQSDNRTLANYIQTLLKKHVEQQTVFDKPSKTRAP